MLNRQAFTEAAEQHLGHLVLQLLRAEDVPDALTWAPLLSSLAHKAAGSLLSAAAAAHGEQDPRYYIKVRLGELWSSEGEFEFQLLGQRESEVVEVEVY
jgi:hypothetical protein